MPRETRQLSACMYLVHNRPRNIGFAVQTHPKKVDTRSKKERNFVSWPVVAKHFFFKSRTLEVLILQKERSMLRSIALSSAASSASYSRSQSLAHNGGPVNGKNKLMKLLDKNLKVVEARILLSELDEGDSPVVGLKNVGKAVGETGGAILGVVAAFTGMAMNATASDSSKHVDAGAGANEVFDYIQRQASGVVNVLSHFLVEIELEDDLVFTFERTSDLGVVFTEGASERASKSVTMVLEGSGQTFADVNAFLLAEGELGYDIDSNNCKHLAYKFATRVMDCNTFCNYGAFRNRMQYNYGNNECDHE